MSTWKKAVGYGASKLKLLLCGCFIILNNPIKVENFTKYRSVCHVAKLPSLFQKRTTRQRYITNNPLQANNLDRVNVETRSLHQNIYFIKIFKSSYHTVRAFTFYFGAVLRSPILVEGVQQFPSNQNPHSLVMFSLE